ncbi:rhamnogalacturonan lyase [Mycena capillaripes]|nr:rhamnogalacturonan lyase [Mycena capillaripes]
MALIWVPLVLITLCQAVVAASVDESATLYRFANDIISFDVVKTTGYIHNLSYAGEDLLGTVSGNAGQLYSDFPSAVFSITGNASAEVVHGVDWAGIVLTDNNTGVGTLVQRSWFLRDGESGLHSFLRLGYYNASGPSLGALGESRTMFRPNGGPWTHIVANGEQWAPLPSTEALAQQVAVQDATWYLGLTPDDAYVIQESDYWTKYTFADNQTNKAHGLFGNTSDGTAFGVWWVVNQKDTFFGGPLHIDLMVDGIAYNKQSTSHGGATSPNITNGFDRTFGPQFLYFNHGQGASLHDLLVDAESLADPSWNSAFYDEIAPYVVGYAPSAVRGSFTANVRLPHGAIDPMAVLSTNGVHFQDNAFDPTAYQYWGPITQVPGTQLGQISIPRVKAGLYRLTVFTAGIFGDFVQDNVVVRAGKESQLSVVWTPESAGRELWRLGVPDKSAGEFRNGNERDETHPNRPAKYRIYWGAWDFPTQFPQGVNFTIGLSREAVDWNYIHWSQYGPTYIDNRTVTDFNNWQINFNLAEPPSVRSVATFTIQLAAAKTTAGNTDDNTGADPTFPISTYVNDGAAPLTWIIQAFESSSCGQRSAISCHLLSRKFEFPGSWLTKGWNKFIISLPFNAPVYVQYDALRLELKEN